MEQSNMNFNCERPKVVDDAVVLLYISLIIGIIVALFIVIESRLNLFVTLVSLIVAYGIPFYLVKKIEAGRNWARLWFVWGIFLSTPFYLIAVIADYAGILRTILDIGILILQVTGSIKLLKKTSREWFKAMHDRKTIKNEAEYGSADNTLAFGIYPLPDGTRYRKQDLMDKEVVETLFDHCQILQAAIFEDGWKFLLSYHGYDVLFAINKQSGWFDCETIDEFKIELENHLYELRGRR